MKISIIGAGAFGTALANVVKKNIDVTVFTRNADLADTINKTRRNTFFFPHKILNENIRATHNVQDINISDIIFLCIPSHAIVDFVLKLNLQPDTIIVNGAKGFGQEKKLIPQILSEITTNEICSLKGPSFASELILEVPTSFTLACREYSIFQKVQPVLSDEIVILDFSSDLNGVEMISILKNIYAIIIGIVDACYNSPNTRFLTFTKALNEINALLRLFNIPVETMFCYAGIGDFGLTSLNDLSRNRTLGLLIGKGFFGKSVSNMVVLEGVRAIENVLNSVPAEEITRLPLLTNLDKLLNNQTTVRQFVNTVIYN